MNVLAALNQNVVKKLIIIIIVDHGKYFVSSVTLYNIALKSKYSHSLNFKKTKDDTTGNANVVSYFT